MLKGKELCKKVGSLTFQHECPHLFYKSQYDGPKGPSLWYVIYRVFWACNHFAWLVACFMVTPNLSPRYGLTWPNKAFFFIYLTNWGLIVQCTDTLLQAVLVVSTYMKYKKKGELPGQMTPLVRVSWFFEEIDNGFAPFVTLLYWCFAHDEAGVGGVVNVHEHLINTVYIMINLFVTARPIQLIHVVYVYAAAFLYFLFTVFYYLGGGVNPYDWNAYVYSVLDWSKPTDGIVLIAIAVAVLLGLYLFCYGVHRLRVWIYLRFIAKENTDSLQILKDTPQVSFIAA